MRLSADMDTKEVLAYAKHIEDLYKARLFGQTEIALEVFLIIEEVDISDYEGLLIHLLELTEKEIAECYEAKDGLSPNLVKTKLSQLEKFQALFNRKLDSITV